MSAELPRVLRSPLLQPDQALIMEGVSQEDGKMRVILPSGAPDEIVQHATEMLEAHDRKIAKMEALMEMLKGEE